MTNEENIKEPKGSGDGAFDFGSILKFVGNTGMCKLCILYQHIRLTVGYGSALNKSNDKINL